jgi:hypothetical protein
VGSLNIFGRGGKGRDIRFGFESLNPEITYRRFWVPNFASYMTESGN